jgi:general secretion pathway protein G
MPVFCGPNGGFCLMMRNFVNKFVDVYYSVKNRRLKTLGSGLIPQQSSGIPGFSLLEIMITLCIIATLASIATMAYAGYREKVTIRLTIVEIEVIAKEIDRHCAQNGSYPDSLSDLKMSVPNDPWGRPYRYLRIDGVSFKGKGKSKDKRRKDHDMVPVNTDYDLYSMGPDGDSRAPFTAKASRDDIVRVQNGKYIGLASAY